MYQRALPCNAHMARTQHACNINATSTQYKCHVECMYAVQHTFTIHCNIHCNMHATCMQYTGRARRSGTRPRVRLGYPPPGPAATAPHGLLAGQPPRRPSRRRLGAARPAGSCETRPATLPAVPVGVQASSMGVRINISTIDLPGLGVAARCCRRARSRRQTRSQTLLPWRAAAPAVDPPAPCSATGLVRSESCGGGAGLANTTLFDFG